MKVSEINRQAIWPAVIIGGAALGSAAIGYFGSKNAAGSQSTGAQTGTAQQQAQADQARADQTPWREAGTNALSALMGGYEISDELLSQRPKRSKYTDMHHIKGGPGRYSTFDSAGYAKAMEKWTERVRTESSPTEGLMSDAPEFEEVPEFKESEGYKWTLEQGLKSQQNALSAMGRNRSGSHLKAATQYAEGLASTEYDNFLNRWYRGQQEKRNAFNAQINPYLSIAGMGQTATQATGQLGQASANQLANLSTYQGNAQAQGQINQSNALTGAITGAANQYLYQNSLRNLQPQQQQYPNVQTIRGGQGGGYGF